MAVYCQVRPLVPESRPTWKQSKPTSSPAWSTSMWRAGSGARGSSGGANDEGVPAMGRCFHVPRFLRAAPDGSVWRTPGDGPEPLERAPWGCNGLARFDGTTWSRYLAGTCIYSLDVAPDGTAWAQG